MPAGPVEFGGVVPLAPPAGEPALPVVPPGPAVLPVLPPTRPPVTVEVLPPVVTLLPPVSAVELLVTVAPPAPAPPGWGEEDAPPLLPATGLLLDEAPATLDEPATLELLDEAD